MGQISEDPIYTYAYRSTPMGYPQGTPHDTQRVPIGYLRGLVEHSIRQCLMKTQRYQ